MKKPVWRISTKWQASCSTLLRVTMETVLCLDKQAQDVAVRALAEYRDQPALCLTIAQAARLWQVDLAAAAEALDALTRSGHLCRVGTRFWNRGSEPASAAS
jgi:hypothetical protein